jgi:hypothetical protein
MATPFYVLVLHRFVQTQNPSKMAALRAAILLGF